MNKPKISIVVPVYNAEKYLNKCLNSLVNQTYENIEIMIIDDGSFDNSPSICDSYAAKDNRITVIHKNNGGVSAARNYALNRITGEYVFFCDSDDWIESDTIDCLYELMVFNKADISIANICFDTNASVNTYLGDERILSFNGKEAIIEAHRNRYFAGYCCGKLFAKNVIEDIRFEKNITIYEDAIYCTEAFNKCQKVVFINKYLYHYVQQDGSALHQEYKESFWDIVIASELLKKQMQDYCPSGLSYAGATVITACLNLSDKLFSANALDKVNYVRLYEKIVSNFSLKTLLAVPKWQWKNLLFFILGRRIFNTYLCVKKKIKDVISK